MKQKINTLLASLALLLGSITMSAQTFEVDGITYTVYNENEVYVSSGSQYEGDLIIPESVAYSGNDYKVTSIGGSAFWLCSGLTSVTIGNSVTSIGSSAFSGCSGLTSVTIPNSVMSIGNYAFYYCDGLTSVTIGNSMESIEYQAFNGCSNLETVVNFSNLNLVKGSTDHGYVAYYATKVINVPNGSLEGDYVFGVINGKNTLCLYLGDETELTLPENYKGENYVIGERAFSGCSGLTSVTIPNSVMSIEEYAFYYCDGLTSVTIGNSMESIEYQAFNGCSNLETVVNFSNLNLVKGSTDHGYVAYYATKVINVPNGSLEGDYVFSVINGKNTLCRYIGDETELTLPENYKGENYVIGESAFYNYIGLTSVTIPNSVTSIGGGAFYGCTGLTSVTIPNSVTSIGGSAFYDCTGLTSVTIPNSVTSIGWRAFYGCTGLTSVHISDIAAWCNIDFNDAFSNPLYHAHHLYLNEEEVKDLVIPNSVTSIGEIAFSGCSGLTSVTIPNSVTSIGSGAFDSCSGLTSVTIPNSVTSIGYYAFDGCKSLTSVTIPNSVTSIGDDAFYRCYGLTSVHISDIAAWCNIDFADDDSNPLYYANHLYLNGEEVKDLVIPNSVTSIEEYAFRGCSGLTSVTIGNSVESIGDRTFYGCTGLTSVVIPNSVTSIGSEAFFDCLNLKTVFNFSNLDLVRGSTDHGYVAYYATKVINDPNASFEGNYVFSVIDGTNTLCLYIGDETELTLPENFKGENYVIGAGAFSGYTSLTSVTIPNSVTSIGDYAFDSCSGLTSVTIPNSVTSIGENAFYNCTGLTSIAIGNSVTSIGKEAFSGCQGLKTVVNFSNLDLVRGSTDHGYVAYYATKVINAPNASFEGNYVFSVIDGTNTLCLYIGDETELTLPENFKGENYVIGASAFSGYTSLTSVTIPNSVTSIGENAFDSCSGLTSVTIPNSVTSIGDNAFSGCSGLTSVTIPNSVMSIGDYAFSGCSALKSVHISDIAAWCNIDFENYGSNPLYYAHHLYLNEEEVKDLVIPNSVTSIGTYAFNACFALTSVTIPNSVTSIGWHAFYDCTGLTSVHISDIAAWCNIDFENYRSNPLYYAQHLYLSGEEVKDLVIPNSVTNIESYAFWGCSGLTSVTIPNSVTSIGNGAFYECSNLKQVINFSNLHFIEKTYDNGYIAYYASKVVNAPNGSLEGDYVFGVIDGKNTLCAYIGDDTELTLPEKYKEENYVIGARAFSGCVSLTSVTIPNSVTSIGEKAFSGCKMIAKITIGNGITSISEYAFENCESLEEVYCLAENVPTTPTNAFRGSYIELATLYVPKVALKRYKVNAPWSGFGEIAEFTQTYTITYILDGVEFKKESWEVGTKIETPQAPEKEGHTFNGWEDVPETMPAMDIVLYGSYTVNIYKVYYYVGKELVHTDEVAYGESIPAYEYIPTNGDKFMGWDGEKYDTMPAHDVTYTANIVSSILYIKGDKSDYTIYDLNGRRIENINNLKNGVYIVNGKMTFVKVN